MSHFIVKAKTKLADLKVGDIVNESDFSCIEDGVMTQLEYKEEDQKNEPYKVYPGIFSIQKTMLGLKLEPTSFVNDKILEDLVNTKEITSKIDCFFRNLGIYKKFGIEIPRRAALLYGPAGSGKTTSLIKVANTYANDKKTVVVIWPTDKFDAHVVKDFIKCFTYVGVDKMILIAEDIGGVEIEQRRPSDASLLSLLDNKEKIFTLPIFTIATTNFPENFLGNLTNRPGRFDDKIEVGYPTADSRKALLKFYTQDQASEELLNKICEKKYSEFSPAHIQEIVIRSAIYEISLEDSMSLIQKEIEHYKHMFQKKSKLGMESYD